MKSSRSGVLAAAFAILFALSTSTAPRRAAAQEWAPQDSATFEIYQDDVLLGTEQYRTFVTHDTLIISSSLDLSGASKNSSLPRYKDTMFLRKADSSYPLIFNVTETARDTMKSNALRCIFNDTTVVIYRENKKGGMGDALALPTGRLYVLEPGIYAQLQTLLGDFVQSSQNKRKQAVLIPAIGQFVDVMLTRGPKENLGQDRFIVRTTQVTMTDKMTQIRGWLDSSGRMWKLSAPMQGLRVERVPPESAPVVIEEPVKGKKKGATKR